MKTLMVVALVLAGSSVLRCEDTALALIVRLPVPPGNVCDPAPAAEAEFRRQLLAVDREIEAELRKRTKEQKAYVKQHEAEWQEQMIKQSGLTPEQIAAMKAMKAQRGSKSTKESRKAAAETRRKIADEALQKYANLSIEEVEGLDKKSKAAKEAWGQAYANQQMASAKADAQSRTDEEKAKDEQERERLGKMAKISTEQKELMDRIGAPREVIWQKMHELDRDAQDACDHLVGPIDALLDACAKEIKLVDEDFEREAQAYKRDDGQPLSREQADAYGELMKRHEERLRPLLAKRDSLEHDKTVAYQNLCARFSPTYVGLIREYIEWARRVQPDLVRYEEMGNERFALQMKTPGSQVVSVIGTLGLQEAKACVDLLYSANKYASEYRNRRTELSEAARSGAEP